jgi:NAD(P)H dehydrogenase (quinone)
MSVNIQVIFSSIYGHLWTMAETIAEGARAVPDTNVSVLQVPETLSPDILAKMGATEAKKAFAHIPVATVDALASADAIIFGAPTRFGSVCAQMQSFLDATGGLWAKGALIGKVGSMFTSTATQHGGQEATLLSLSTYFYHQGMVIVGCPYAAAEQMTLAEISGGSPYGATTIAGGRGERLPSENEKKIARYQGGHVARIAAKLAAGR